MKPTVSDEVAGRFHTLPMDRESGLARFERVQDGQARKRKDREWRKEFEKSGQLLSDQIIATALNQVPP